MALENATKDKKFRTYNITSSIFRLYLNFWQQRVNIFSGLINGKVREKLNVDDNS